MQGQNAKAEAEAGRVARRLEGPADSRAGGQAGRLPATTTTTTTTLQLFGLAELESRPDSQKRGREKMVCLLARRVVSTSPALVAARPPDRAPRAEHEHRSRP